jgi:DNA-binding Lrp family transcriptional regulator
MKTPWTQADTASLIDMRNAGASMAEMAKRLGRTAPSVKHKLRELVQAGHITASVANSARDVAMSQARDNAPWFQRFNAICNRHGVTVRVGNQSMRAVKMLTATVSMQRIDRDGLAASLDLALYAMCNTPRGEEAMEWNMWYIDKFVRGLAECPQVTRKNVCEVYERVDFYLKKYPGGRSFPVGEQIRNILRDLDPPEGVKRVEVVTHTISGEERPVVVSLPMAPWEMETRA